MSKAQQLSSLADLHPQLVVLSRERFNNTAEIILLTGAVETGPVHEAADQIAELGFVAAAKACGDREGWVIKVVFKGDGDGQCLTPTQEARFRELVGAKFVDTATATANIRRPDGAEHTQTMVTIEPCKGGLPTAAARKAEAVDGVERALIDNRGKLRFAMTTPSTEVEQIRALAVAAAAACGLYLKAEDCTVFDDDVEAALVRANDWKQPAKESNN